MWVEDTTKDDEPSITLPGLPEGFDEVLAPVAAGDTPVPPEVRATDPLAAPFARPLDADEPEPMTSWIRDLVAPPPSEVETQRLDVSDESLVELRDTLRAVLEEAEPPTPTPTPPARSEAPAPVRRSAARDDVARITAGSSLAGFATVLLITVVVLGILVLVRLGA